MDFYKWKDDFNIGNEAIDQQHREFLVYLNNCHQHVSGEKRAGVDADIFNGLKIYAAMHFRFEEEMMRKHGYPGLERQQQQHMYFESQIAELKSAHAGEGDRSAESVLAFMRDWFLNHILEEDNKFVPYVR